MLFALILSIAVIGVTHLAAVYGFTLAEIVAFLPGLEAGTGAGQEGGSPIPA